MNVRLSLKAFSSKRADSPAYAEATKMLTSTIEKLNAAVEKVFDSNAVFAVITLEERHVRSKRQATGETVSFFCQVTSSKCYLNSVFQDYNLAQLTSKDYPVVFNIMFWFTIIFIFSLIAISLALSNVEDKDSIIYRMTGARGKKDN